MAASNEETILQHYCSSPMSAEYEDLWIRKETAKRIHELAETNSTKASKVLYTVLTRYVEKTEDKK